MPGWGRPFEGPSNRVGREVGQAAGAWKWFQRLQRDFSCEHIHYNMRLALCFRCS